MQSSAIRLKHFGLDGLALEPIELGEPGPNEVLVEFHAASLNYRDVMTVLGHYNAKMELPRILGSDAAGEVLAVGSAVTRFAVGDRVCSLFFQNWQDGEIQPSTGKSALGGAIDGVFASARIMPETGLVHAPAGLTYEEAATLPCAALTAWNALVEMGRVRAGQTVLILGTGGVSLFALQISKVQGARVIVTSSSDEKLKRARALGADETINYRRTPEWDVEVFGLTGKRGVDHVVEVGGAGTLPRSLRAVRPGGRVYVIGVLSGAGNGIDVRTILSKSINLNGVYVGSAAMFGRLISAIEINNIKPVVDRTFPLAEAADALATLQSGSHFGKVVLTISQ